MYRLTCDSHNVNINYEADDPADISKFLSGFVQGISLLGGKNINYEYVNIDEDQYCRITGVLNGEDRQYDFLIEEII